MRPRLRPLIRSLLRAWATIGMVWLSVDVGAECPALDCSDPASFRDKLSADLFDAVATQSLQAVKTDSCTENCVDALPLVVQMKTSAAPDTCVRLVLNAGDTKRSPRVGDRLLIDLMPAGDGHSLTKGQRDAICSAAHNDAVRMISVEPLISLPEPQDTCGASETVQSAVWKAQMSIPALEAEARTARTVAAIDVPVPEHVDLPNARIERYIVTSELDHGECPTGDCCKPVGAPDLASVEAHGTEVLGLIAATGVPRLGGDPVVGVAAPRRILSISPFDAGHCAREGMVAAAVRCAVDHGADIINMSLGSYSGALSENMSKAMHYAASRDVLVVMAAGIQTCNLDAEPIWPAALKTGTSLTVGTISATSGLISESGFGRKTVDMAVPIGAMNLATTQPCSDPSKCYCGFSHTSAATAIVSGAAALVWDDPQYAHCSAHQIHDLLKRYASPFANPQTRWRFSPSGGVLNLGFLNARGGTVSVPDDCRVDDQAFDATLMR